MNKIAGKRKNKNKRSEKKNKNRQWLETFAGLIDRITIHQLKEVFVPEHKNKYRREMDQMVHDLDLLIADKNIQLTGKMIRAVIVLAQINEHIWYNESAVRQSGDQDLHLLKLTHGLNGVRSETMNYILRIIGDEERRDYKTDCLAAEFSSWEIDLERE